MKKLKVIELKAAPVALLAPSPGNELFATNSPFSQRFLSTDTDSIVAALAEMTGNSNAVTNAADGRADEGFRTMTPCLKLDIAAGFIVEPL